MYKIYAPPAPLSPNFPPPHTPTPTLTPRDIIELLPQFEMYLVENERSENTVEKYLRDVRTFAEWQTHPAQTANETPNRAQTANETPNRVGVAALCDPKIFAQTANETPNRVGVAALCDPQPPAPAVGNAVLGVPKFSAPAVGAPIGRPQNPAQPQNCINPDGRFVNRPYNPNQNTSSPAFSPLTKSHVIAYKNNLISLYAPASVNSMLCSLNSFFAFVGRGDLRVKQLKIQRRIFCSEQTELTRADLGRLLSASRGTRIYYILCTLALTGIRISELKYITAGAVQSGVAEVKCKGKTRRVYIPRRLRDVLTPYIKKNGIKSGSVFVTRGGKPIDRSNVWRSMKKLCKAAGVSESKVFPHNFRHLFAREFYSESKDITRLADILGHSSVNTTRIYTCESGKQHRKTLDLLCRMIF